MGKYVIITILSLLLTNLEIKAQRRPFGYERVRKTERVREGSFTIYRTPQQIAEDVSKSAAEGAREAAIETIHRGYESGHSFYDLPQERLKTLSTNREGNFTIYLTPQQIAKVISKSAAEGAREATIETISKGYKTGRSFYGSPQESLKTLSTNNKIRVKYKYKSLYDSGLSIFVAEGIINFAKKKGNYNDLIEDIKSDVNKNKFYLSKPKKYDDVCNRLADNWKSALFNRLLNDQSEFPFKIQETEKPFLHALFKNVNRVSNDKLAFILVSEHGVPLKIKTAKGIEDFQYSSLMNYNNYKLVFDKKISENVAEELMNSGISFIYNTSGFLKFTRINTSNIIHVVVGSNSQNINKKIFGQAIDAKSLKLIKKIKNSYQWNTSDYIVKVESLKELSNFKKKVKNQKKEIVLIAHNEQGKILFPDGTLNINEVSEYSIDLLTCNSYDLECSKCQTTEPIALEHILNAIIETKKEKMNSLMYIDFIHHAIIKFKNSINERYKKIIIIVGGISLSIPSGITIWNLLSNFDIIEKKSNMV